MSENKFNWSEDATVRVDKVPEGFMRNMTKMRIEEHAGKSNITDITLEVVESVIDTSRAGMGSAMGGDMSAMNGMGHPEGIPKKTASENKKENSAYYMCFVCSLVVKDNMPENCPNCSSPKEKYSDIEEQYVTESSMKMLEWSEGAKKILNKVPEDFRQEMTKWEIEGFCRKKGYLAVTADVVEERYEVWDNISKDVEQKLKWCDEVTKKIEKIPPMIRGMVVKEMESFAMRKDEEIVSVETLESIKDKWVNQQEFHVKWQK